MIIDKLDATVQRHDGALLIKLAGIIDQDNRLAELAHRVGAGRALIDLGDIQRINSSGTRDWINWIAELEARGVEPVLLRCSPAVVSQLNHVKNFSGCAIVKSFYVPYHCPYCDVEKVLLVDIADMGPPPHQPPPCRCDECGCSMIFDDMPDSYFALLSAQLRASAKWIDKEIARGSSTRLELRRRMGTSNVAKRSGLPLPLALKPAVPRPQPAAHAPATAAPWPAPPRQSPAVTLLIGALLAATAALAYLVASG